MIDQKDPKGEFTIGHSLASSQTFMPHFRKRDQNADILYADIAGLMDTGGRLIDYINCFVNKKLFTIANRVKILFPVPFDQLKLNRCGSVLEQVSVLQNMCEESPDNMIKSVLPIITKCKLVSPDNDDAEEAVDLELVKGQLQACFEGELNR